MRQLVFKNDGALVESDKGSPTTVCQGAEMFYSLAGPFLFAERIYELLVAWPTELAGPTPDPTMRRSISALSRLSIVDRVR